LGQEASLQASTILHISPAGVRQIQQALNKQGYDAGHVDGHWNPQTSTAVKNFQQMQGLQPTGQLTTETLGALGLGSLLQGQGLGQAGQVSQWLVQEAAANPGTPLWVSPAGVRQIQQALNKQGYDAGHIDGQWNPQTSTAVKNFQQMQGLEPTGNLDIRTIVALGLKDVLTGQGGNQAGQWLAQEAARGGGTQLHISSAEVRQIQQALDQMGYKIRNIDGQWNPQTATALKNFQQAQGLEPTGNLNTVTISALRLSNVLAGEVGAGGQEQTAQQQGGQMGGVQPSDQRLTQERASGGIPGIASGDQQQGGTTMIGGSINGGQAGAGSQTQMGGQTQPGTQGTVSGQIGIGAQGSQPITKKRQSSGTTIYWIKPEVVQK
jgi:peptidoglycan hydrolase-like protein with peptidoglycan-binding domain